MIDKIKVAVGYVRCSTEKQDDSIEQQKNELMDWAIENDYKIIRWYEDEGKSGTSFEKRSAFMQLKSCIETNVNFEFVLVYDESRWGRAKNLRESNYWKYHFEKKGVKVVIINSGSNNKNNIGDIVIEAVESAEATEYSKKLSRSVLRGSKANAKEGYSSGGTAPYGYERLAINKNTGEERELKAGQHAIPKEEKVTFILGDPFEVKIVEKIYEKRLIGHGYKRIAEYLNSEKIPCPKRGRWKNKDQKWSVGTVRSIIKNRTYCGDRVYNKHPQSHLTIADGKKQWINPEEQQVISKDMHPAVINRKTFEKANNSIGKFIGGARFIAVSPYLLSGLIKCDHCGFNYQGSHYKHDGLSYYVDGGYKNKGKSVCESFKIPKKELERFAIKSIRETIGKSNIESLIINTVRKSLNGKSIQSTTEYARLHESIDMEKKYRDSLIDTLEIGGNKIQSIINRIEEHEKKIEILEMELEKLHARILNNNDIDHITSKVKQLLGDFDNIIGNADIPEKKKLMSLFIEQIQINRNSKEAVFYVKKLPTVHRKLETPMITVSGVAEEGLEPPTPGL